MKNIIYLKVVVCGEDNQRVLNDFIMKGAKADYIQCKVDTGKAAYRSIPSTNVTLVK